MSQATQYQIIDPEGDPITVVNITDYVLLQIRHKKLVEALGKISKVKFGLDGTESVDELYEHWSKQALNYESIARAALAADKENG